MHSIENIDEKVYFKKFSVKKCIAIKSYCEIKIPHLAKSLSDAGNTSYNIEHKKEE